MCSKKPKKFDLKAQIAIFKHFPYQNMFKCIVIDDELHAIEGLQSYIEAVPELVLIKSYTDPVVALKEISMSDSVDIIFMDVDMPKITGLELAQVIRSKTNTLVFTTAHTKYAYDAFETNADAYLLKPYSLGKFVITINRLLAEKLNKPLKEQTKPAIPDEFFFVKNKNDDYKIVRIYYSDIIAVESKLNHIMIYVQGKQIVTKMSLTEFAKKLADKPEFIQLQRSFIVRKDQIETINGNMVKMNNGIQLTVGELYRKDFNDFVTQYLVKTGKKN